MSEDRFVSETTIACYATLSCSLRAPLLTRLMAWCASELDIALLRTELVHLPPPLLEDLGIAPHDIHAFARRAVRGEPSPRQEAAPGPASTIGSAVWTRAFLLHHGPR